MNIFVAYLAAYGRAAMNNTNTMLQDLAYDYLKKAIRDGKLEENKIYSLSAVSKMLDMSKTPVRDALQMLSREDLIEILPSRGFRLKYFSEQDVTELYQLRCAIEGYCCHTIAVKYSEDHKYELIDKLRNNLLIQKQAVKDHASASDFLPLDIEFHNIIYSCVNNTRFNETMNLNRDRSMKFSLNSLKSNGIVERSYNEHKLIYDAIIDGDPLKAYTAMLNHLKTPYKRNLEQFKKP